MEEKKYVYANIKIPIEITGDSYELMNDYMSDQLINEGYLLGFFHTRS